MKINELLKIIKYYLESILKTLNDIADYSVKGSKKKEIKVNKIFKNK